MNERITLHFADFDEHRAERMLRIARTFATTYIDRPHGIRNCVGYVTDEGWSCAAYWTRKRAVVVRENPAKNAQ